jgi:hypothetical protein
MRCRAMSLNASPPEQPGPRTIRDNSLVQVVAKCRNNYYDDLYQAFASGFQLYCSYNNVKYLERKVLRCCMNSTSYDWGQRERPAKKVIQDKFLEGKVLYNKGLVQYGA